MIISPVIIALAMSRSEVVRLLGRPHANRCKMRACGLVVRVCLVGWCVLTRDIVKCKTEKV